MCSLLRIVNIYESVWFSDASYLFSNVVYIFLKKRRGRLNVMDTIEFFIIKDNLMHLLVVLRALFPLYCLHG